MRTFAAALLCVAVMGVDVTRKTLQFESSYGVRSYTPKIALDLPQYGGDDTDSDDGEITFKRCADGKISTYCRDDITTEYDRDEETPNPPYEPLIPGDSIWRGRVYDTPRFSRTPRGNTAADVTKW